MNVDLGRWIERGRGVVSMDKDAIGDQEWKRKQSGKEIEAVRGCKLHKAKTNLAGGGGFHWVDAGRTTKSQK